METETPPCIRCDECGWISFHPQDVAEQRCGWCHAIFRDDKPTEKEEEAA